MTDTIAKILKTKLGINSKLLELKKLHGDASYRTYYRASLADGKSFIVMQMPEGKSSVSEEVTNFKGTHGELPFMNIARYLKGHHIPVPDVYHYDESRHLMILEDLGDGLMAGLVADGSDSVKVEWYRKAIDLLVKLQTATKNDDPSKCVALQRSFDTTLLNWEFDHFLEYGMRARGINITASDEEGFASQTSSISDKIRALPYGFTHRDFQSRNLIIHDGTLYLIDFQDALTGPSVYDLVALMRDSYVKLSDTILEKMIAHYTGLVGRDMSEVRVEFDLVTVQRKLKDAGRFVYIDRVKGNPGFLEYIPTSLDYVRAALRRMPDHTLLYDILNKNLPEWK